MSRITKKTIFASLALMTFASQLMSAPLPLPGSSPVAETLPKPAFAQTDQVLPSWPVTYTFEQLGRPGDSLLLGINSADQVEFGMRRDRIASDASLQLEYTPSPSLIPTVSHIRVYLNDVLMGVLPIEKDQLGRKTTQRWPLIRD